MAHTRLAGSRTKKARGCTALVRMTVSAAKGTAMRKKYFQSIPTRGANPDGKGESGRWTEGSPESMVGVSSRDGSTALETLICGAPQAEQKASWPSMERPQR